MAALSTQLQRTETTLQAETVEHAGTRRALAEATVTIGQLEERTTGLATRVGEHEAHARSLEEKHQHARETGPRSRISVSRSSASTNSSCRSYRFPCARPTKR